MNFFKPKEKVRTTSVNDLKKKAEEYLRKHYTKTTLRSVLDKLRSNIDNKSNRPNPKFYMLEPDSINGISQGICNRLITKNGNTYKEFSDDTSPVTGCHINIEYNDMSGTKKTDWKHMHIGDEIPPIWNRQGGEQISKYIGNTYISSESARTVKLGGKHKFRRITKSKRKTRNRRNKKYLYNI